MDKPENNETPRDQQQIAATIRETMTERGLSQSEVARQADMSATVLSEFLSGTYRGNREEVCRKLIAWRDALAEGDSLSAVNDRISQFTDTPVAKRVQSVLKLAKLGNMVMIAGTSGIGKTETLKHFQRHNTAVWYAEFSEDTQSVYSVLAEIGSAVGIADLAQRPDEARREIVRRIERTNGLLICDEAQHLSSKGLEQVRTLHDRAKIGIVFAGHLDLADNIAKLPQVHGRIVAPLRISGAAAADADALFDSWGLDCKRSRAFLRKLASRPTGLRGIAKAYGLAALYAIAQETAVTYDHIANAWAELNGPGQAV